MKVAIDAVTLSGGHEVRGIGVHTKELLKALKAITAGDTSVTIETFDTHKSFDDYDLIHFTHYPPFFKTLPEMPPKRFVVTIHDLTPLIFPKHYPPGITGKRNFAYQKRRARLADAIITISETSKKDICRFLGIAPERVHVVYLAPKKVFRKLPKAQLAAVRAKYNLPERFVLYVGDVNYNKNLPTLITACTKANVPLVICGKHALEIDDLYTTLENLKGPMDWYRYLFNRPHPELAHYNTMSNLVRENGNVYRTGFVPDSDLVALYNLATLSCFPAYYEGFGLVVIESMACGTPVVASKTQALVEVGGDAAVYVDPHDSNAMATTLKKVMTHAALRRAMVQKGRARARQFSWEKTARETLEVYRSVVAND